MISERKSGHSLTVNPLTTFFDPNAVTRVLVTPDFFHGLNQIVWRQVLNLHSLNVAESTINGELVHHLPTADLMVDLTARDIVAAATVQKSFKVAVQGVNDPNRPSSGIEVPADLRDEFMLMLKQTKALLAGTPEGGALFRVLDRLVGEYFGDLKKEDQAARSFMDRTTQGGPWIGKFMGRLRLASHLKPFIENMMNASPEQVAGYYNDMVSLLDSLSLMGNPERSGTSILETIEKPSVLSMIAQRAQRRFVSSEVRTERQSLLEWAMILGADNASTSPLIRYIARMGSDLISEHPSIGVLYPRTENGDPLFEVTSRMFKEPPHYCADQRLPLSDFILAIECLREYKTPSAAAVENLEATEHYKAIKLAYTPERLSHVCMVVYEIYQELKSAFLLGAWYDDQKLAMFDNMTPGFWLRGNQAEIQSNAVMRSVIDGKSTLMALMTAHWRAVDLLMAYVREYIPKFEERALEVAQVPKMSQRRLRDAWQLFDSAAGLDIDLPDVYTKADKPFLLEPADVQILHELPALNLWQSASPEGLEAAAFKASALSAVLIGLGTREFERSKIPAEHSKAIGEPRSYFVETEMRAKALSIWPIGSIKMATAKLTVPSALATFFVLDAMTVEGFELSQPIYVAPEVLNDVWSHLVAGHRAASDLKHREAFIMLGTDAEVMGRIANRAGLNENEPGVLYSVLNESDCTHEAILRLDRDPMNLSFEEQSLHASGSGLTLVPLEQFVTSVGVNVDGVLPYSSGAYDILHLNHIPAKTVQGEQLRKNILLSHIGRSYVSSPAQLREQADLLYLFEPFGKEVVSWNDVRLRDDEYMTVPSLEGIQFGHIFVHKRKSVLTQVKVLSVDLEKNPNIKFIAALGRPFTFPAILHVIMDKGTIPGFRIVEEKAVSGTGKGDPAVEEGKADVAAEEGGGDGDS